MPNHIKIYGVKPRIQYVADGNLTSYEFPFAIFKTSDIDVYLDDKLQEQSAFTVSASPDTQGGTVIFETAPANGIIISIVRNLSIERTTDFQEGGALRAKVLNDEFDYQTACLQQVADNLNRSMVLPPYATETDVDLTLPTPSAGKAIVWNAEGTNLENSAVKINELESTLKGYKESAEHSSIISEESAESALQQVIEATRQADIASAQAQIATEKAQEATATLASKANKNLDNISVTGKGNILRFVMPDYTSKISIPYSTSVYQIPVDALVCVGAYDNGNKWIDICNKDGTASYLGLAAQAGSNSFNACFAIVPAGTYLKGKRSSGNGEIKYFPLKGTKND